MRETGSGNIGATNVARSSPVLGLLTLLLDAGKGLIAVILAQRFALYVGQLPHNLDGQGTYAALQWVWPFARYLDTFDTSVFIATLAALSAIIGHLFPLWLSLRGGKGVATAFGSFVVVAPKSVLCVIGIFVVVFLIFRYVSLSSVTAVACFPVAVWLSREYRGQSLVLLMMTLASLLIIWKHGTNIRRLVDGTEPKFERRA